MKRYDADYIHNYMDEDIDGEYCRYEDALKDKEEALKAQRDISCYQLYKLITKGEIKMEAKDAVKLENAILSATLEG